MQKHLKVTQQNNGKGPFSGCRNDWQLPGPAGEWAKARAAKMRRPPFKPTEKK